MQDAVDFNDLLTNAIHRQKGEAGKHQLAGVEVAARTTLGMLRK